MAELATLARPYAEALFQVALKGQGDALAQEVKSMAEVLAHEGLRQFVSNPQVGAAAVVDVVVQALGGQASPEARNLLKVLAENERLATLSEISVQLQRLLADRAGVAEATVYSAFPIDAAQLADVQSVLETRFARKLHPTVVIDESLIGGIRVVVGDEVLDTSVKARLEQMRAALTA